MAKAIREWFSREDNRDWLLVFDGYDNVEDFDIKNYFPRGLGGSILLTTRRNDLCAYFPGKVVPTMEESDAIELLQKAAGITGNLTREGNFILGQHLSKTNYSQKPPSLSSFYSCWATSHSPLHKLVQLSLSGAIFCLNHPQFHFFMQLNGTLMSSKLTGRDF